MMKRKASAALIAATSAAVKRRQDAKKKIFVRELSKIASVTRAASLAKIDRTTIYLWRRRDSDFAQAWERAISESIDRVEAEALAFALKRPPEGSSSMSAWVNLVQFVLRSHKPDPYRERQEIGVLGGFIYVPQKEDKEP
jgi:hypothetical protein